MADLAHFADELIARQRELRHPLCVGLDPHLGRIPEAFRSGGMRPGNPETAVAVEAFLCAAVDRLAGRVAAIKPQIAFFEQLGWPGLRALSTVVEHARSLGLLVLLDAKRGDIGSTAEGYAQAYLAADAPLRADAMTVNPYLGGDTLKPFLAQAELRGAGVFVLVKTSNPGSVDLQDRVVEGSPVYEVVARSLAAAEVPLRGPKTGWSCLGAVVGASWPEQAERIRELLPRALFLVPGYGAQGGSAVDAVRSFVPGPNGLEGGLVNSSRAILFAGSAADASARAWETAFDAALSAAIDELGAAVAGASAG